ncbi:MAG: circularly permuted type 2 ATP-grasp protein, partial [Ilumatobacteraceae bacterium]
MAELRTLPRQWDELVDAHGSPRPAAAALVERLRSLDISELQERQTLAEVDILALGITFTVYHDGQGTDRAWPMDIVPRVIAASEWATIERGLKQRLSALNRFIDDVYHERRVIADGVFPAELLEGSVNLRRECIGVSPKFGVWAHICGSDLVRDANGVVYVLEDNLRVPSGVSYLLQNRAISKRAFADLFERQSILPVDDYPDRLRRLLTSLASDDLRGLRQPQIVVLTPGVFNSAYFEHSFL